MFDKPIEIKADQGVTLTLYHYRPLDGVTAGKHPVLLLHGASANHLTFTTGVDGGLARYLATEGFDVWILNWRGSGLVVDDERNRDSLEKTGDVYNFNAAAERDVPLAIGIVLKECQASEFSALGFCMGSAVLAEAVALGHIKKGLDRLVLMTLGLFYEAPIDGRLKGEDRILERLRNQKCPSGEPFLSVDPRVAGLEPTTNALWPQELEDMFKDWPAELKSHQDSDAEGDPRLLAVMQTCNRVSFMYGMPYSHCNLVDEIHGFHGGHPVLPSLFGAIPLRMYIHGAQNIRQGQATSYTGDASGRPKSDYVSDDARERFRSLKKVTLITGALNRLWHRDSIDRMYEWLRRGSPADPSRIAKRIFRDYGHQDLLWGRKAPAEVFKTIADGLKP